MDDKVKIQNKIPEVPLKKLETLWLQVGGTLCNLECSHCFISCSPRMALRLLPQRRNGLEQFKMHQKTFFVSESAWNILIKLKMMQLEESMLIKKPSLGSHV